MRLEDGEDSLNCTLRLLVSAATNFHNDCNGWRDYDAYRLASLSSACPSNQANTFHWTAVSVGELLIFFASIIIIISSDLILVSLGSFIRRCRGESSHIIIWVITLRFLDCDFSLVGYQRWQPVANALCERAAFAKHPHGDEDAWWSQERSARSKLQAELSFLVFIFRKQQWRGNKSGDKLRLRLSRLG